MNSYIASHIRHILTCLATLGVLLASHKIIDPSSVSDVNQAGSSLISPLTIIGTACVTVGIRLLITLLGKLFPAWAATLSGITGGSSGGVNLLLLAATAAVLMGALPSCSTTVTNTTQTLPDGTKVTTAVTAKSSDAAAVTAAETTAVALLPIVDDYIKSRSVTVPAPAKP